MKRMNSSTAASPLRLTTVGGGATLRARAIARSMDSFSPQTKKVIPCLSQGILGAKILLVQFGAALDLRKDPARRKIIGLQNGVGGADGGFVMGVAAGG